jgi:hypothetical protein
VERQLEFFPVLKQRAAVKPRRRRQAKRRSASWPLSLFETGVRGRKRTSRNTARRSKAPSIRSRKQTRAPQITAELIAYAAFATFFFLLFI